MGRSPAPDAPVARPARLGPLETIVLEALWDAGPQDVVGMQRYVASRKKRSRNTIHSTLERLVRKRLASREKRGRLFVYRARLTRSEWLGQRLAELIPDSTDESSALLWASFVDVAERAGEDQLRRLERLVRARRLELESSGPEEDST